MNKSDKVLFEKMMQAAAWAAAGVLIRHVVREIARKA